jgi:hypothetical protein
MHETVKRIEQLQKELGEEIEKLKVYFTVNPPKDNNNVRRTERKDEIGLDT